MLEAEKTVYVKFQEPETYRENGRHIFAILNAFTIDNYTVYLSFDVQRQLESIFGSSIANWPPPAKLAIALPGLRVVNSVPPGVEKCIYVFDTQEDSLKREPWRKRLRVGFDLFSPYRLSRPIIMPYAVHPMHANKVLGESLGALRAENRNVRILFAGDLEGYKRRWIRFPSEKLSRMDVISTIRERLDGQLTVATTRDELDAILAATYTNQLVIVDNDNARVPWEQWVDVIARADFFLCPPGIVMPMCHNIIEAMAIGTIPITNYPEWFSPKLEHLKNCIVFDGKDDLVIKANMALAMSDDQMAEISDNAIKYYDQNLQPQTFVSKVEARSEARLNVLMYSEYNVAKQSAKLNGQSVLMRGEDAAGNWAWLTRPWR